MEKNKLIHTLIIIQYIYITLTLVLQNATTIKDVGFMFITIGLCLCSLLIDYILNKKTNMSPIIICLFGEIPLVYPLVVLCY